MTEKLADKKCVPCRGGVPPLSGKELKTMHESVPKWTVEKEHHLHREFKFPDFKQALDFVNRVGRIAQAEDHHPDLHLRGYRNVTIELSTHDLGGLSENDFIVAAKINQLPVELKK